MQPDSEHNGALDPYIIGYLTTLSTTADTSTSAHLLATRTRHIASYITQGSQTHKYETIRLNVIDLQI